MRRRELIAGVGLAALGWPGGLCAQAGNVPVVGIFIPDPTGPTLDGRLQGFLRELAALGWREGDTVRIERRFFGSDQLESNRMDALATELTALKPDVIWTLSSPLLHLLEQATRTVPIVFMNVADPVASGFAKDVARPAGNATGFAVAEASTGGKWLDLLRDVAPEVTHAGMLYEADTPDGGIRANLLASAATIKLPAAAFAIRTPVDVDGAIAEVATRPKGGLIVAPSNTIFRYAQRIIELAAANRLPAVYAYELFAKSGGLIAYGPDLVEEARGCADYVDKILRGAKPGELPIQFPTKYRLVVNLKTAKALGIAAPQLLLAQADEIIE